MVYTCLQNPPLRALNAPQNGGAREPSENPQVLQFFTADSSEANRLVQQLGMTLTVASQEIYWNDVGTVIALPAEDSKLKDRTNQRLELGTRLFDDLLSSSRNFPEGPLRSPQ